jgi:hypothetical protein
MCGVSRKENAMEATKKTKPPVLYIVRTIFLGIVLLAGLFWTWFGIASGIAEGGGILGTFMHTLMPGLVLTWRGAGRLLEACCSSPWEALLQSSSTNSTS